MDMLPHCPLLTRLEIPLRSWMCDRPDKVTGISAATRLRIFDRLNPALFKEFPALQDLEVDFREPNMVPDELAALVTKASLFSCGAEVMSDLLKCRNLTDLTVEPGFSMTLLGSNDISLPKLRNLAVDSSTLPVLRALLWNDRCHNVESVVINCTSTPLDAHHVPALLEIIAATPSVSLVTIRVPAAHITQEFVNAVRGAERSCCAHFAVVPRA